MAAVPEGRAGDASDVARPSRRPPSAEASISLGYPLVRSIAAWLSSPLLSIMSAQHVPRVEAGHDNRTIRWWRLLRGGAVNLVRP